MSKKKEDAIPPRPEGRGFPLILLNNAPEGARPVFKSVRPRLGRPATISVSSTIQASGTLTELGHDGKAVVDVGGREVEGRIIPAQRRITLAAPPPPINGIEEEDQAHDDPSPC